MERMLRLTESQLEAYALLALGRDPIAVEVDRPYMEEYIPAALILLMSHRMEVEYVRTANHA